MIPHCPRLAWKLFHPWYDTYSLRGCSQPSFPLRKAVHHSSLQIEVVVLDSAATYQSGKLVLQCCMKSLHGQFWRRDPIKDSPSPRGRLVMADVRQLRWLQGWTRGYERWSQSQDFTDFDQCIWDPRIAREILWTRKKPTVGTHFPG